MKTKLSSHAISNAYGALTVFNAQRHEVKESMLAHSEAVYVWLEQVLGQDKVVLVSTGDDVVIPPCAAESLDENQRHLDCITQETLVQHILLPAKLWQEQQESLHHAHEEWRASKLNCRRKKQAKWP